jgi:lipoate synthase
LKRCAWSSPHGPRSHNVETVPRLFKLVQPQYRYDWARVTLSNAKKLDPDVLTKSGIMVGLGETLEEIKQVMRDQRSWGVDILTIGQYLQPSRQHLPIERYYTQGIRRTEAYASPRFRVGRERSAGALLLPCRRTGCAPQCCAQKTLG